MMVSQLQSPKRRFPVKPLIILAIVAVGAYVAFGRNPSGDDARKAAAEAPAGPPVSIATVINKPITQWSNFSGILQAVNSVEVRPRVGGQITAIHFKDGSEVKKGQGLFTIDTRPYEAEAARAKGQLVAASGAQANAAQDMARATKLIKSKAISQSEYEQRASALKQANGQLESAKAAARTAEINLAYAHITAPITGKISRAEVTVGNLVDPSNAQALASIVDLSPVYASFDIDEQTFLKSIQGTPAAKLKTIPVEVAFSNNSATYTKATIHSFDNQITPGSGTIRVRALLPNTDGTLVPGLYAQVRLGSADETDAILIHPTAVNTDQSKKFVMVVDKDSKAEYREVTLGGIVDGLQVVSSGLKPGEQIIVSGLQRARPGTPIAGSEVDMITLQSLNPTPAAETPAADKPAEAAPATDAPKAD
ncbi:MAG: efflux RND transporter periplasmic adaptor subunit [Rickettsiales bacterium]